MPWRQLAPVVAAVAGVHLLVLHAARPAMVRPAQEAATRAFSTRSILPPARPTVEIPARQIAATPMAQAAAPASPSRESARVRPGATAEPAARQSDAHQHYAREAEAPKAPSVTPAPAIEPATATPEPVIGPAQADATPTPPPTTRPVAVAVLQPARFRYEVHAQTTRGFSMQGEAQLQWRHDGSQYEAMLELRGTLLPTRTQRSRGQLTREGLAPRYFADRSRSEQATHFDAEQGRVVFSNNRPQVPLVAGMQDRLSVILQLAVMVGGDAKRFPAGTQIVLPTASTREAEHWVFNVEAEEELTLPGGSMRAIKLQRLPRRDYDQKVELWLAPHMDYAPVRLRLTNPNGDTVDQRWSSTDRD